MVKLIERLRESAERLQTISCFGNDPVLGEGKVHLPGTFLEAVSQFYSAIFSHMRERNVFPAAFKPNHGFYSRHNKPRERQYDGYAALDVIMSLCEKANVPTILDFKRGDIKKSSDNYAVEGFDGWRADSVTTHAYMGIDSMAPFFERGGTFMMCKTSNKSAKDLQDLEVDGVPIYMKVAELAVQWARDPKYAGNVGVVLGATYPEQLSEVARFFVKEEAEIALLIPGVGAQGGSAEECMEKMAEAGYDHRLARINSSSGLNFAYAKRKRPPEEWAGAAVDALKELNQEINLQKYLKSA